MTPIRGHITWFWYILTAFVKFGHKMVVGTVWPQEFDKIKKNEIWHRSGVILHDFGILKLHLWNSAIRWSLVQFDFRNSIKLKKWNMTPIRFIFYLFESNQQIVFEFSFFYGVLLLFWSSLSWLCGEFYPFLKYHRCKDSNGTSNLDFEILKLF